ncbi:MAG: hypothetical protein BWK73_31675 [Thiothrix lacustris]|jgi:hypothetical protein|uniref:Uncharacterized protein n=1 Tax=Thiothrix lacustris TaxID=525917 RepID=A0A1Y1QI23_9GAMM|nr:MAG: hypothetical protein BWK73_31675 [Thiothrix lacustris]
MKKLYLIDDETRFYPRVDRHVPDGVDLLDFTGAGMLEEFQNELNNIKRDATNCFFLIDVLMPVPHYLQTSEFWIEQGRSYVGVQRKEVCGVALAHFLIEKEIYKDNWIKHIRLVTSYPSHMVDNLKNFTLHTQRLSNDNVLETLLIHKDDVNMAKKLDNFIQVEGYI